jgi:hypothetical protein
MFILKVSREIKPLRNKLRFILVLKILIVYPSKIVINLEVIRLSIITP